MKKKKIVVTGGSGFIGTHFIKDFSNEYDELVNIDIQPPFFPGHEKFWKKIDLLDFNALNAFFSEFCPTHVVHLAARTDLDEKNDINGYAVNIQGVRNVINSMVNAKSVQRFVVASSMLVCRVGYIPKTDNDYSADNLYAQSKVETECITRCMDPAFTWTIVRPTTIWGPFHYRLKNGFFDILQKKMYVHPGTKKCNKSYGYVGNTVFQIKKILDAPMEEVRKKTIYLADLPLALDEWVNMFSNSLIGKNISRVPYSCMKAVALIGDILGFVGGIHFPMNSFRLRNMTTDNVIDTHEIEKLYVEVPYSMKDGVEKTCQWLRKSH